MQLAKRIAQSIFYITLTVQLGCASTESTPVKTEAPTVFGKDADDTLIATDLISALMQLPGHDPWSLTVQLSPPKNKFGRALNTTFSESGYGVQNVDSDQGINFVSYSKSLSNTDSGIATVYSLRIGDLTIERKFKNVDNTLFPSSPIHIKGISPKNVRANGDIYRGRGVDTSFPGGVLFIDNNGQKISFGRRIISSMQSNSNAPNSRLSHERLLVLAKAKLFSYERIDKSHSDSDIRLYRPVKQAILHFPSKNPEILGDMNKDAIRQLTSFFDHEHNAFSITGCSHGNSLLWDGTEGTALERQIRVKEELLIAGIKSDRILDNGCFKN